MITIGMNYQVLPGKEEAFERAFSAVLNVMQQRPGHTRSQLYKDVHRTGSYLIMSDWNDQAAFDTFIRSEQFAKVTAWGNVHILADRPKHQVFTPNS